MDFIWNFPLFSIVLCLFSGVISSVLSGKAAKYLSWGLVSLVSLLSAGVLYYTIVTGQSFTYMMGHYPAPWGNEVRAGVLEGILALFFSVIMLLSIVAGDKYIEHDIPKEKQNLFYSIIDLMMSSIMALVYTNDIFTAYVFIEINTIAACGLVMMKNNGKALLASAKYLIMSLLGSGLLLLGITLLYDVTGHLLMSNIQSSIAEIVASGQYQGTLTTIIALISVALAIKSALFPFHSWLPDAYAYATPSVSGISSGLVTKIYIVLLIKIFFRVIGWDVIVQYKITDMLFVFGVTGMLMGSINAIRQKNAKKMIAYSSVAQFGYIYMGLGLGNMAGVIASLFHIFMHSSAKSMLFVSLGGLIEVSKEKVEWNGLKGSAYRNRLAGIAFTMGSLAMIGIPMFGGFISKILFATAAVENEAGKMGITLGVLAISTVLNAWYFFRAIICIYTPSSEKENASHFSLIYTIAMIAFIALNLFFGTCSDIVIKGIQTGLAMFS